MIDVFNYNIMPKNTKRRIRRINERPVGWDYDDEMFYSKWKQALPENLKYETDDYDLVGAYLSGMTPTRVGKEMHLYSRDPSDGRILKSPTHPTYGLAVYGDIINGGTMESIEGVTHTHPSFADQSIDRFRRTFVRPTLTPEEQFIEEATQYIKGQEGRKEKHGYYAYPYIDTHANISTSDPRYVVSRMSKNGYRAKGAVTSGHGQTQLIDIHPYTEDQAYDRLREDVIHKNNIMMASRHANWYKNAPNEIKTAIIDMMHQGGNSVLSSKMPKFVKAMSQRDYAGAYKELDFSSTSTRSRNEARKKLYRKGLESVKKGPEPFMTAHPYDNSNRKFTKPTKHKEEKSLKSFVLNVGRNAMSYFQ